MAAPESKNMPLTTADIAGSADAKTGTLVPEDLQPRGVGTAADERRRSAGQPPTASEPEMAPLFGQEESQGYRTRWDAIQTGFVDEPRKAVEEADALVAQVMKQLAEVFAQERSQLEHQWEEGDKISTEDLRMALRHYRSFFERLLKV
jgi:hypothetical protein